MILLSGNSSGGDVVEQGNGGGSVVVVDKNDINNHQFQIFKKLSQDPVATAEPSSVTPRQLTRLS
jgi:hypothetical protein